MVLFTNTIDDHVFASPMTMTIARSLPQDRTPALSLALLSPALHDSHRLVSPAAHD